MLGNYVVTLNLILFALLLLLLDLMILLLRIRGLSSQHISRLGTWRQYIKRLLMTLMVFAFILIAIQFESYYDSLLINMIYSEALNGVLFISLLVIVTLIIVMFVMRLTNGESIVLRNSSARSDWETWKAYIKGQGMVLLTFLLFGVAFALVSSYYGPLLGQAISGGQLVEYRNLDISDKPVTTEYIDVNAFSHIIVFTKVITPANSLATVSIYGIRKAGVGVDVKRIESGATWMRWDQESQYSSIRVIVERPAREGAAAAKQVDVLIYLNP